MMCNFNAYTVFDFTLTSINGVPNKLMATWEPLESSVLAYIVYCNTSASQAYPEQIIGPNVPTARSAVNGTTLTATITGLNPYTNYDCYVLSIAEVSFPMSNIATARTNESSECVTCLQCI